jgi:hypothetical protein
LKKASLQVFYLQPPVLILADALESSINVEAEGQVNGCQIYIPVFTMQVTKAYAKSTVNAAKQVAWMEMTGKINSAEFRGFGPEDVLYLGVSGSTREPIQGEFEQQYVLTHSFAISPSHVIAEIAGSDWVLGTGIEYPSLDAKSKRGWDFVWFKMFKNTADPAAIAVPGYAYVEKVYQTGNFNTIL